MNSFFSYKHQIIILLTEISKKLDKILAASDFTREDAFVKSETQAVKDATGRLPSDKPQPKDTN